MNKKLQVFVSSTYTDLIEERQAAVQAILDAGHIPAGMELFKAGKSQMKTIRKWIDDSDVYMLILGGRYGSIEEESGLSYTELEYKYALSKNMPVFAIVLDDSFLFTKASFCGKDTIFEKGNTYKYNSFKDKVESNIVKYVKNIDQISSVVHAQLNNIINDPDYNLIGWIRNTGENDTNQPANEVNALLEKNELLNKQIQELQDLLNKKSANSIGDYSFNDLLDILKNKFFNSPIKISAFDFFINNYSSFSSLLGHPGFTDYEQCKFLEAYNLIEDEIREEKSQMFSKESTYQVHYFKTSKHGIIFYTLLESNNKI